MLKFKHYLNFFITFALIFLSINFNVISKSKEKSDGSNLIRDAEIENYIRSILFKFSNAEPDIDKNNLQIYIINDDSINAFVAGGQNIFVNTGLIRKFNYPSPLIGVLAHEFGHLKAGHIALLSEKAKDINKISMLSYILAAGAMVAGSPEIGQTLIMGGYSASMQNFLKYTREQEEVADKIALDLLKKINESPSGLIAMFKKIKEENGNMEINEYFSSHPLTQKRIEFIQNNSSINSSPNQSDRKLIAINAKLEAFFENPNSLINKYKNKNDNLSKYKKSIAYYRLYDLKNALKLIDEVINDNNKSFEKAYLYELKAQFFYDNKKYFDSIVNYKKAINMLSNIESAHIKYYLASSIEKTNIIDIDLINYAIRILKEAKIYEKNNLLIYQLNSKLYYKINKIDYSYYDLAEFHFLKGEYEKAQDYIVKSEEITKDAMLNKKIDELKQSIKEKIKDERKNKKN